MNKIEKMIKELCPNGVEWKKLGEECQVLRGKRLTKSQLSEAAKYKVYHGGIEPIGFYDKKNRDADSVMIINVGASAGTIGYSYEDFWSSDGCFCISHSYIFCNRFLYYYLISIEHVIIAKVRHAGIPTLDSKVIENIEIPLPPLPIQTEIVRILDKFVEQQEQLERLIELRKKQYEYYREEMLKPKEGEEWETKTIGELGTITRGRRFVRDDVRESGMPCIHYGDMYTYYGITARTTKTFLDRNFPKKMQYAKKGDVVVVGAGENDLDIGVGTVWEGEEPAAVHDACYILEHKQNPKYIAYFLRTNNYHQQLRKYVSDGKICSISGKGLGSCIISIPSLKKQEGIVEFLDKFESSIATLTSALEASKKRYEYYRDEMMRF